MTTGVALLFAVMGLPSLIVLVAALLIVAHPDRSEEAAEQAALLALGARLRSADDRGVFVSAAFASAPNPLSDQALSAAAARRLPSSA